MIGSFYSGVSGLQVNQLWLDIVGNNLANVNTTGFKKSRPIFEDILNKNLSPAEEPRDTVGGVNPKQVGTGVTVGAIETLFTQGTDIETKNATDLAIIGENSFFVLSDGFSPSALYTRNGTFKFDAAGNLVNQEGLNVQGWNALREDVTNYLIRNDNDKTLIDTNRSLEGVKMVLDDIVPGEATTKLTLKNVLNAEQKVAIDPAELGFTKNIESMVPISAGLKGVNINAAWAAAGFNKTPDGLISINGAEFKIGDGGYSTPIELINAINNSSLANVTITTDSPTTPTNVNKFIITPKEGKDVELTETPATFGHGFFTQSMIKAGTKDDPYTYNTSFNTEIQFEHLLDPGNPDKNYYRWRAIDPKTTDLLTTNAYHYEQGDVLQGKMAIDPGSVIGERLKLESFTFVDAVGMSQLIWYANISNPDIDSTTLRVYINDPLTNSTILANQGKWRNPDPMGANTTVYYFDNNGDDARFGKAKNGLDRIVFSTALLTPTLSAPQAVITVDYKRNGFNMHNSTIDPASLKIKQNGAEVPASLWKFNDNQGIGGNDQVTFYSAASKNEVVTNNLSMTAPFTKAGFNWNAPIGTSEVWSTSSLSSRVHLKWTDGSWTSGTLSSYGTVAEFMTSVKDQTNGKVTLEYDVQVDRFTMKNTVAVSAYQTTANGFFSLAKLKGEGTSNTSALPGYSWVMFEAGENPTSRDEVVSNYLDTRQSFRRAGFNNGGPVGSSIITFSWVAINPDTGLLQSCIWPSPTLSSFTTVDSFINQVNDAVETESGTNRPLPVILRYDPVLDKFTLVNTNHPAYYVRVQQSNTNGFLTNAKLLTDTLGANEIPHTIVDSDDNVTADYYSNKSTNATGILELDANGKVINNFIDTEAAPVVMSTAKIMGSGGGVNMAGGWGQFPKGMVDGTITITTKAGTYTSRFINSDSYATVLDLFQEINNSNAKVNITYHPDTDRVSITTTGEGDEIVLEESGLVPLFSAFNITTGKVVGGNNNGVMDLDTERPTPIDGWLETTGLYGTGKDYFRVNIIPNEIKNDIIGTGGQGMRGSQVLDEIHRSAQTTINLLSADVDDSTITVYDVTTGVIIPKGKSIDIGGVYWEFSNNTGQGSRDEIKMINNTGMFDYYVSYTRLNAFDLSHADVDETSLVVKVAGRILSKNEYTFLNSQGTNGLDRILIQPDITEKLPGTIGTGEITVNYRLTMPQAVDFFIPNGNDGPENIRFTPNSSLSKYDRGGNAYQSDSSQMAKAVLKNEDVEAEKYRYTTSTDLFDAFGVSHRTDIIFERLRENKWLWTAMNPVEKGKIAGYGLLMFDGAGNFDMENSQIFGSPSDPGMVGGKFKGIYFDPPVMPTPPESGGAPPPENGANTIKVNVDFDLLQQTETKINITEKDGVKMGKLIADKVKIRDDGSIIAAYDNGQNFTVGQIATAYFFNPSGLERNSGTTFRETVNSGDPRIDTPGSAGHGMLKVGHLEGSNVDLIKEFADMIVAQRAFQANGKTVTTADQIFQDITGLKR
ncbi:flagellar hook-basal body complex protein [Candidatus Desantisbacteria bacterium]|nr:flagellar hook-basal body complex protein [Candidatus Desantisbacteria bacterium]